jgi:hypothetical protein
VKKLRIPSAENCGGQRIRGILWIPARENRDGDKIGRDRSGFAADENFWRENQRRPLW